jgi:hypothetical protein
MPDSFARESRSVRHRLAPVVERVLERHGRQPPPLADPPAPTAPWFTVHDASGAPLVLVSAHAHAVNFLLGKRGFVYVRPTAAVPSDHLASWFEEVLDGALSGGLVVHGDGERATLQTRSGAITLTS